VNRLLVNFKYRSGAAALRSLSDGTCYFAQPGELNDSLEAIRTIGRESCMRWLLRVAIGFFLKTVRERVRIQTSCLDCLGPTRQ
jgi:hypothetical protein